MKNAVGPSLICSVFIFNFANSFSIAFSRAGAIKGVSTARATSLVSLLAYAGLLFAPPAFGLSAEHFGLHTALCAVPVLLTITVLLAFLLGRLIKHSREDTQAVGS